MTRLKTVCAFVYAYALLFVHISNAQSSNSCISSVNLSVASDCSFTLSPELLRATGDAATAGSVYLDLGSRTGSGIAFTDGQLTTSLIALGIPNGGVIGYQLFASDDATGRQLCWGEINLEIKNTPAPITNTIEIMCSQSIPELPTRAEVLARFNGLCAAPISDIVLNETIEGDACIGFTRIRTLSGIVNVDDSKNTIPLQIDTIIETPLTLDMIVGPLGGPNKEDAVILTCDDIGNAFPTPAIVEEFSAEGVQGAYPFIPKGPDTTIVFIDTIIQLLDTMTGQRLVTDDFGNELWITAEIVNKRDTIVSLPDTTITDVVLVLREEAICNLGITFSDETFPGCAGPDSKVLRTWTVLDWCNGDIATFEQWIIIETDGPIIEPIDDAFSAIQPWVCTASFPLNAQVDRGCSETLEVVYTTTAGVIEDNKILTNLWPGDVAVITVTAIDDCGQRTIETFTVTPVDSLAPVAIAEDQINVSLSGDPVVLSTVEDRGTAKVLVDAIDAGSNNSGCGEVDRCILLREELEDPVLLDGVQVMIDGRPIYHAKGCTFDGVIPERPGSKNTPGIPAIPFVFCKDFVQFCCASIGFNEVAMVVTNQSDIPSITWTQVLVEDKTSSLVICPQDFTVGCEEGFEIPQPQIFNGICTIDELEMTMTEDFDNCGDGTKTVIWTRNAEVVCTLVITVDGESAFNPYEIKWPKHFSTNSEPGIRRECEPLIDDDGFPVLDDDGFEQFVIVETSELIPMGTPLECTAGGFTGEPTYCSNSCGLIGVNFEDQSLDGLNACRKIIRRWTLIDWCTFDPNSTDEDEDDSDTFIAINDEWLEGGEFLTDHRTTAGEPCTLCEKPSGIQDDIYFRYTSVDEDGFYNFDQVINILDFDDPEVTAPDTISLSIVGGATAKGDDFDDCFTSGMVDASVTDFCGGVSFDNDALSWLTQVFRLTADGPVLLNSTVSSGPTASVNTEVGMSGDVHLITWTANDGCGNEGRAETIVLFIEDKEPTPICISQLSTANMSTDGTTTIWAVDFDAGSFDNCSPIDLFFLDEAGNFSPSLTFGCEDITDGSSETFSLDIFAVDELGNHDFCTVEFRINDFSDTCPDVDTNTGAGASIVAGAVATSAGDKVENVEIALDFGPNFMTQADGDYVFRDILSSDFDISAARDDDHINGVTALDLVLVQRHLLGLTRLDDPFKIIAADINGDGRVSAFDLVDLRRLILGTIDRFPNNSSWRFLAANQTFVDPLNPFPFTEVISIRDFDGQERSQNFMAVKIGDINSNAVANSLSTASSRSGERLTFVIEDNEVKKGTYVNVGISAINFDEIMAYQYTMNTPGLRYVETIDGALDIDESMIAVHQEDMLSAAWTHPEGRSSDEVLYTIVFEALEDVRLSDAISISGLLTESVAYNTSQQSFDIEFIYEAPKMIGLTLRQNVPNPFEQFTTIGFDVPTNGTATITIYDVTGKLAYERTSSFRQGSHSIKIDRTELQEVGVLYYQLSFISDETGEQQSTSVKKMIILG